MRVVLRTRIDDTEWPWLVGEGGKQIPFWADCFEVTSRGPSESQSVANKDPPGSLIADAFEVRGIDDGFRKPYRMSMAVHPIMGKPLEIDRKDS
jgi:hypothetical protein